MAKPQNLDKLILSVVAALVATTALSLTIAGSFVPRWTRPVNGSRSEANTSYSLWGQEDCYGIICTTKYREIKNELRQTWEEDGETHTEVKEFIEVKPIVTCVVANYCNMSWFGDVDFTEVPSLLFVARAFIIPSFISGFICVVIYIVKIVMIVLRPTWRRLHVKAAYLTFAAVAGMSAGIGVIIFVTMLEKEVYELLWAPVLPGVGGVLFLLIAIGGYLSWRNHSTDEEFDDRSEFSERMSGMYEFSSSGKGHNSGNGRKASRGNVHGKNYQRSVSQQSGKSDIL